MNDVYITEVTIGFHLSNSAHWIVRIIKSISIYVPHDKNAGWKMLKNRISIKTHDNGEIPVHLVANRTNNKHQSRYAENWTPKKRNIWKLETQNFFSEEQKMLKKAILNKRNVIEKLSEDLSLVLPKASGRKEELAKPQIGMRTYDKTFVTYRKHQSFVLSLAQTGRKRPKVSS